MTGSSTSSSTWMLLVLLLPLFSSIQQSSSAATVAPICKLFIFEFSSAVDRLGGEVKNCWKNCSSVPITDRRCQCINITVSEGCSHPGYFIQGLRSLDSNLDLSITKILINKLKSMERNCIRNIPVSLECDGDVISPKTLYEKLETLKQILSSFVEYQ